MLDRRKRGQFSCLLRIYYTYISSYFASFFLFPFFSFRCFIRFVSVPQSRFGYYEATSWWLLFNQMAERYDLYDLYTFLRAVRRPRWNFVWLMLYTFLRSFRFRSTQLECGGSRTNAARGKWIRASTQKVNPIKIAQKCLCVFPFVFDIWTSLVCEMARKMECW